MTELLDIKRVYYESAALDYGRGNLLFSKYQAAGAEMIETDDHWRIESLNEDPEMVGSWNHVKSSYLVLGVKKSVCARENCRSTDWIAPSLANGCAMACAYCYVARRKGYANPITVFVNIERIIKYLRGKCQRLGTKVLTDENAQTDPKLWTFDIGENCDCSVDDLVSDNVKDLIEFFAETPNAKASFATKYVNRNLLNYDPKGHTRIRFSLMPEHVARVVDVRTSPISERIAAINDFVEAGYEVHINLSPVIIYDGWKADYVALFDQLNQALSPKAKQQLKAEVIFLTHNEALHALNMQWHPKAEERYLWRHWDDPEQRQGKNKFGHEIIQQRKISQNGMVNLRYKNNWKSNGVDTLRSIMEECAPYCEIRYIF